MAVLVPPDRLTDYGYPRNYSNRHRLRLEGSLEDGAALPYRVPVDANHHAYVESELIAHRKAYVEALIAKRDAKPKAKPLSSAGGRGA
jgi:hypothetical protein